MCQINHVFHLFKHYMVVGRILKPQDWSWGVIYINFEAADALVSQISGASLTNMVKLISQQGYVITSIIKFGMKLLIHSQTSTVALLKFGNEVKFGNG